MLLTTTSVIWLLDQCSVSTGLRSEGTRKGMSWSFLMEQWGNEPPYVTGAALEKAKEIKKKERKKKGRRKKGRKITAHGDIVNASTRPDRTGIRSDKSFSFPGGNVAPWRRLGCRSSSATTTPAARVQGTTLSGLPWPSDAPKGLVKISLDSLRIPLSRPPNQNLQGM